MSHPLDVVIHKLYHLCALTYLFNIPEPFERWGRGHTMTIPVMLGQNPLSGFWDEKIK